MDISHIFFFRIFETIQIKMLGDFSVYYEGVQTFSRGIFMPLPHSPSHLIQGDDFYLSLFLFIMHVWYQNNRYFNNLYNTKIFEGLQKIRGEQFGSICIVCNRRGSVEGGFGGCWLVG